MLDAAGLERVSTNEGIMFQRWLKEHVEPRLVAIEALVERQPMTDVYTGAILDKCITPFVYWAREQPLSQSQAAPSSASVVPQPGNSLSTQIPEGFKQEWGLIQLSDGKGVERIEASRHLGDAWKRVSDQLKTWGFQSRQEVSEGKSRWFWERRVTA